MRTRDYRRYRLSLIKRDAKKLARRWGFFNEYGESSDWVNWPSWIGNMISTHCKPCSCTSCGNPRRTGAWGTGLTMQEQRALLDESDQLDYSPEEEAA